MAEILVATETGCHIFRTGQPPALDLPGRSVGPLAPEPAGTCLAIVDEREIWRRSLDRTWTRLAIAPLALQSLVSNGRALFAGGLAEATIFRISDAGTPHVLDNFNHVPGRNEWFAGGPPLGVRSLALTGAGRLLAAVHVGGMPRSQDEGRTWHTTIPILYDVHEVRAHPHHPDFAAAATAVGLCVTHTSGEHWDLLAAGLDITNSLAVAVLDNDVLFSIQDGPFAKQSQLWRWPLAGGPLRPVRDGLPPCLEGKIDTAQLAAGSGRAAFCDGGGNLWVSTTGAAGWSRVATGLGYATGVLLL